MLQLFAAYYTATIPKTVLQDRAWGWKKPQSANEFKVNALHNLGRRKMYLGISLHLKTYWQASFLLTWTLVFTYYFTQPRIPTVFKVLGRTTRRLRERLLHVMVILPGVRKPVHCCERLNGFLFGQAKYIRHPFFPPNYQLRAKFLSYIRCNDIRPIDCTYTQ